MFRYLQPEFRVVVWAREGVDLKLTPEAASPL